MHTNEIISYDLALSPNMEQIKRMLDRAFRKFPSVSGLIFHSDQSGQYQHNYYRTTLAEHGIQQSISKKGNYYDIASWKLSSVERKMKCIMGMKKITIHLKTSQKL